MSRIQGVNLVLELSTDGITYKGFVCEVGHTLNRTRSTNQVDTKCYGGTSYTSLGTMSGTIDLTGVLETAPDATQVSGNEMFGYSENGTLLYWRLSTTGYLRKGQGYIVDYSEDAQSDGLVTSDFTLQIDGPVTTV